MRRSERGLGAALADEEGATLVEFALMAPMFLLVFFVIIQIGALGMMSANLDAAVQGISRQIRTGQDGRPTSAAEFRSLICAKMADSGCPTRLQVSVQGFGTQPGFVGFAQAQTARTAQDPNDLTKGQPFKSGVAGEIMMVTATYKWPLALPFTAGAFGAAGGSDVLIVSRLVFRNEPFS